ncbi:MAG: hypothetical protein ABR577_05635 [Pyrinomonadaceae bacterium]
MKRYGLVHIVTNNEFAKPLVASQVFDQAQVQAETGGAGAPERVAVWAIEPMRALFTRASAKVLQERRRRCPDIDVRLIGGIGRFGDRPALITAARLRRKFFKNLPVIYHCRGESAAVWGNRLRELFPADIVALDVRGVWPLELLYTRGITDLKFATDTHRADYESALLQLQDVVSKADVVTTVSHALRDWLVAETNASSAITVVPCCVKTVTNDEQRLEVRRRWGVRNNPVLIYSGTVAAYQHLEDLVLPFMRAAQQRATRARAVLLTPELDVMRSLAEKAGLDDERTIIESLPQSKVAESLTGGDMGLLLRVPTTVNVVSQPTKVSEYLAAGLPLVVEKGTGGVPPDFDETGAGLTVVTAGQEPTAVIRESQRALEWLENEGVASRAAARKLAANEFTWAAVLPRIREMYAQALDIAK